MARERPGWKPLGGFLASTAQLSPPRVHKRLQGPGCTFFEGNSGSPYICRGDSLERPSWLQTA